MHAKQRMKRYDSDMLYGVWMTDEKELVCVPVIPPANLDGELSRRGIGTVEFQAETEEEYHMKERLWLDRRAPDSYSGSSKLPG